MSTRTVVVDLGFETKFVETPVPYYVTKWTLYHSIIYVSTIFKIATSYVTLTTTVTVPTTVTVTVESTAEGGEGETQRSKLGEAVPV